MYNLHKEKNINVIYDIFVILALITGVLHLALSLFDTTLSVFYYGMANVPSISYIVSHLIFIYLPLLLLMRNERAFPKALLLRWVFYALSLCYLLGNSWIIYFIAENSFAGLSADAAFYQDFQREYALLFNYMTWNCYTPVSLIFGFVNAALCFICGKTLETNQTAFRVSLAFAYVLTIAVPITFATLSADNNNLWVTETVFLLLSQLSSTIALFALSVSPRLWAQKLWSVARRDTEDL